MTYRGTTTLGQPVLSIARPNVIPLWHSGRFWEGASRSLRSIDGVGLLARWKAGDGQEPFRPTTLFCLQFFTSCRGAFARTAGAAFGSLFLNDLVLIVDKDRRFEVVYLRFTIRRGDTLYVLLGETPFCLFA